MGLLAEHLYSREDIPVPSCVLVRHRGTTRLYKLNESGLLLQISLKSIDAKDRNRLRKEGVMGRV